MRIAAATVALLVLCSNAALAFEGRVVTALGDPVAGAEVTVLGRTGTARTDADGRFTWAPNPSPPFEILVIAPGGVYMKPVLVERLDAGPLQVTVEPIVNEVVTVSGSAGSIETTPAAATATLTSAEIQTRTPANLMQALENVPGVTQVSEGQAAVPAVRGLARGRTLILVDGARVSSERRVGPSATLPRSRHHRGRRGGARSRLGRLRLRRLRRGHLRPHQERRAARAAGPAGVEHRGRRHPRPSRGDGGVEGLRPRRHPLRGARARRRGLRRSGRPGLQFRATRIGASWAA